jgi:hypothetical protein
MPLKMKAAGSSETLVFFYQIVYSHIPEDNNLIYYTHLTSAGHFQIYQEISQQLLIIK